MPLNRPTLSILATSIAAVLLGGAATTASAQTTYNWNVDAAAAWNDGANWLTVPTDDGNFPNAAGDTANVNFDITAARTISLNQAITVGTLNLSDTDFAYTIATGTGTNTLTLNNSGAGAAITTAGVAHTISTGIVLGDALTFNLASGLTSSGVISGSNSLVKTGVGTLTLSGTANNTFVGGINIQQGTVATNDTTAAQAFGNTANVITLGGVGAAAANNITLQWNRTSNSLANNIVVENGNSAGTTTLGSNNGGGASRAFSGTITLNRSVILGDSNNSLTTFSGEISGTGGITTKNIGSTGTHATILTGANTYSGGTTLRSDKVRIGVDSVGTVGSITSSAFGTGAIIVDANGTGNSQQISSDSTTARTILNTVTFQNGGTNSTILGDGTRNGKLTFAAGITLATNTPLIVNSAVDFDGTITETGGARNLAKSGGSTLTFSGTAGYTGTTTVSAGTLIVSGSISGAGGAASITGGVGSTLGGAGSIARAVTTTTGTVAPGNAPATLGTLSTGNLSVTTGTGRLSLELGTSSGGLGASDRINVTGTVNVTGSELFLGSVAGYSPVINDVFYLTINNDLDAVVGQFGSYFNGTANVAGALTEGATINFSGQDFMLTYAANFEGSSFTGGNDIALLAVPEPSCAVMLLGGFGMLGLLRRRRA